jgi:hypothetical protein
MKTGSATAEARWMVTQWFRSALHNCQMHHRCAAARSLFTGGARHQRHTATYQIKSELKVLTV